MFAAKVRTARSTGQVEPTEPAAADTCPEACIKQGLDYGGR
jgi:hypothetical protein